MLKSMDSWIASLIHGHESEQALGGGDEQGSLVCCSALGCKELDANELN